MSKLSQYVTFYSNDMLFGIDISVVNEVNTNVNIMPVPLSDQHIRGLVNIRGQVVLVMDTSIIFGNAVRPVTGDSHIIILKTHQELLRIKKNDTEYDYSSFGDKPYAFLVDMIGDVVIVPEDEIDTPTQYIDKYDLQLLEGVVKLENDLMAIVNPVKMLLHKGEDVNIF